LRYLERQEGDQWAVAPLASMTGDTNDVRGTAAMELARSFKAEHTRWLFQRYDAVCQTHEAKWKDFSFGRELLREKWKNFTYMSNLNEMSENKDEILQAYLETCTSAFKLHARREKSLGRWTHQHFGGWEVPNEDHEIMSGFVSGLFRSRTGDGEHDLQLDMLDIIQDNMGFDLHRKYPLSINDEELPLRPVGWEHTHLGAAWRRRKLQAVANEPESQTASRPASMGRRPL
jgi:hypothetical protein